MIGNDLEEVLAAFFQDRSDVLSAYLFGSRALGNAGPLSDVDIAVLLRPEATRGEDAFNQQARMHTDLMALLETDKIDLVALHEAGPLLAHRVIRDGKRVYVRDEIADQHFRVRALQQYLDTAPIRRLQSEALRRRIAQGQFGQGRR